MNTRQFHSFFNLRQNFIMILCWFMCFVQSCFLLNYISVITSKTINKFVQKCQYYYTLSDQSVLLVTVTSVVSLLTKQLWFCASCNCSASSANKNKNNFTLAICTKHVNEQIIAIKFRLKLRKEWNCLEFI